jgi:hypothetical protein
MPASYTGQTFQFTIKVSARSLHRSYARQTIVAGLATLSAATKKTSDEICCIHTPAWQSASDFLNVHLHLFSV